MGALHTVRYATVPLWPRVVNAVLGAWLFASAFLWPHDGNTRFDTWGVGLLVAATAIQAIWAPALRYANTFLAAWLGFMGLVLEYKSPITRLHDLGMAGLVFVLSLVPGGVPEQAPA